jgi:type IV conjugative transfer system protein TraL
MNHKEHRIYQYMSEPLRIAGLTLDEISLGSVSLTLFFTVSSVFWKVVWLAIGILGVCLIKRLKKLASGFSLKAFLHWHLGLRFGMPSHVPPSWKRLWLP